MIPSHMFQVRVRVRRLPHRAEGGRRRRPAIVGQTFRPSEQACVNCHGEKYRGMLQRWADTLARMREIVAPKLAAAPRGAGRRAGPEGPEARARPRARGRRRVQHPFVALGKGVHNVFYAADLLKLVERLARRGAGAAGQARRQERRRAGPRAGTAPCSATSRPGVKQQRDGHLRQAEGPPRPPRHRVRRGLHRLPLGRGAQGGDRDAGHVRRLPPQPAERALRVLSPRPERLLPGAGEQTGLVKVEPNVMASAVACTGCHDWSQEALPPGGRREVRRLPRRGVHGLARRVDEPDSTRRRRAGAARAQARRDGARAPSAAPGRPRRGRRAREGGARGAGPRPEGARRPQPRRPPRRSSRPRARRPRRRSPAPPSDRSRASRRRCGRDPGVLASPPPSRPPAACGMTPRRVVAPRFLRPGRRAVRSWHPAPQWPLAILTRTRLRVH